MLNPETAVTLVAHSLLLATKARLSLNLLFICGHNTHLSPNGFKCKCMDICLLLAQNSHNYITALRYTFYMSVSCS